MSKNENLEEYFYLFVWVDLFAEFLGWTKEQTVEWLRNANLLYFDKDSIIYYDRPQDVIMSIICGKLLQDKLASIHRDAAADLIMEVEGRVAELNQYIPHFTKIDLKWYHTEVDKILSEYR